MSCLPEIPLMILLAVRQNQGVQFGHQGNHRYAMVGPPAVPPPVELELLD